jgi:hypothetical protein
MQIQYQNITVVGGRTVGKMLDGMRDVEKVSKPIPRVQDCLGVDVPIILVDAGA